MNGLLFDTSLKRSLTAITSDDDVILECRRQGDNGHSATLLRDVEHLMQEAGLKYGDIDFIGAGIGPGSFTGVRVAVSTAKGLAFSLKKPIAAVCSLDVIAAIMPVDLPIVVMVDAGRQRVYTGFYPAGTGVREGKIRIIPLTDLARAFGDAPVMVAGPALIKYHREIKDSMGAGIAGVIDGIDGLTAQGFLRVVQESIKSPADPVGLAPLYLQEPTIRKKDK